MSTFEGVLYGIVLACLVYLAVVFALDLVLALVAFGENRTRIREAEAEDYATIAASRFTIPVSIIAPMRDEEVVAVSVVDALLAIEYPELEVIIVNDGSSDATLDILLAEYGLQQIERFPRRVYETGLVRAVYRSTTDPRLTVVDKETVGVKADAVNCGLNFARYRYVCCVDGDTIYHRDALLRSMRRAIRDPGTVIGITSQIEVATRPEIPYGQDGGLLRSPVLQVFQHLEYLRAFLNDRLAWSRLSFMLCTSGAFMLYRRDVLDEVGGFSNNFSCEDIELTFRVHERFLREKRPYQIVAMPEAVGRTEGPSRHGSLISQRARWQRVILETTWEYRRMFLNPKYGRFGLLGFPFLVLSEVLAPFMEALGVTTLVVAALLGLVSWTQWALLVGVMSFANAGLTVLAIRLEDVATRSYRVRDLLWLIALSPLEIVFYRPPLLWAHAQGVVGFARGDRSWERFDRNERSA